MTTAALSTSGGNLTPSHAVAYIQYSPSYGFATCSSSLEKATLSPQGVQAALCVAGVTGVSLSFINYSMSVISMTLGNQCIKDFNETFLLVFS